MMRYRPTRGQLRRLAKLDPAVSHWCQAEGLSPTAFVRSNLDELRRVAARRQSQAGRKA